MKNIYKILIVVGVILLIGGYLFPRPNKSGFGAVSSGGAYNTTTSWSSVTLNATNALGTSTSILNSGASDRAIIGSFSACSNNVAVLSYASGAGLANWILTAATTTTSGAGLLGNTNYIVNENIATTSLIVSYISSTTEGVLTNVSRIWPVNTYLTFNLNATSTASCSVGVEWLPL